MPDRRQYRSRKYSPRWFRQTADHPVIPWRFAFCSSEARLSDICIPQKDMSFAWLNQARHSIIGKVFTGNIFRIIRTETIPRSNYASTPSVLVLLNQSILPLMGLIIYIYGNFRINFLHCGRLYVSLNRVV